jgi:hypothetical protein
MGMFIQKSIRNYKEIEIKNKVATLVVFTVTVEPPEAGSGTTKLVILPILLTVWAH